MATLYDLELQESNNFIHLLMEDGASPALKLMMDQVEMAKGMGDAGKQMLEQLNDPESDMGKNIARMKSLKEDVLGAMTKAGLSAEHAKKANAIFSTSPESLDDLNDAERSVIKDYWTKKKMVLFILIRQGYSHEELFS